MRKLHQTNFNHKRLGGVPLGMLPITGLVALAVALVVVPYVSLRDTAHADGAPLDGISISLDKDTLNLSSTNADTNGFVYDKVTASVTTSSSAGYNLYMSAAGKDKDDNYTASLVNVNDKKYTIDTLADNTTLSLPYTEEVKDGNTKRTYTNTSSFTTNTWAYSVAKESDAVNTSVFYPIPLDTTMININSNDETISSATLSGLDPDEDRSSKIHSTENATGSAHDGTEPDNIDITLAARSDNTLPAGNYENNIVFTAISKALPGIEVTFNADGLYFNDDKNFTTNTVLYDYDTTCRKVYTTLYSHTPNISDAGVQDGNYSNSMSTNEVLSMPGVDKLHITLTYAGESASYDWVSIWQGDHSDYAASNNYATGITLDEKGPKFGGGSGTTVEGYVEGDTITIAFRSDGSGVGNGYGYYAVIDGYMTDPDGNELKNGVCGNFPLVDGGEYISPTIPEGATFLGWSTDQGAQMATYADAASLIKTIGSQGKSKLTLYAVWGYKVTITAGDGIATGPTGDGLYHSGKKVQLSATCATGYRDIAWEVTSGNATLSSTYATTTTFIMPAEDVEISAAGVQNSYVIKYNANGGGGAMMDQVVLDASKSEVLTASNFWRSGYGFLGWSTSSSATVATYGPNETVSALSTTHGATVNLYAIWRVSAGNMQNWTGCSSMNIGDVTALKDTRDNNVYAVAKLADGNCWSVENLRLSSGTISSSNTHNPASGFAWPASSNSWCASRGSSACMNAAVINTNNINSSLTASPTTNDNSSSWYGYGVMYNYYAVTAGNGTYEYRGIATGDICPAGWHLPTSNSTPNDFDTLYDAVGRNPANNISKYPNNFVYSGYWEGSTAVKRGTYGLYMSPNAGGDNSYMHSLQFDRNSIPDYQANPKYWGGPVRCIAG